MITLPRYTITLSILVTTLMLLPETAIKMLFLKSDGSNAWGWITGHLVHADYGHFLWNVAAFLMLGSYIEKRSPKILLVSLLCGITAVNIVVMSSLSEIQYYCGLSGVLNTLVGVALFLHWERTRSTMAVVVGVLCAVKIGVELSTHSALFTDISVRTFPLSHLAGALVVPLAIYMDSVLKTGTNKANTGLHRI